MAFKIFNSAKRKKQEFFPINSQKVGMYVCGVTVYDLCHIGHARSAIFFDVFVRFLRAEGYKVIYVRNFTDIDDKIINRAKELGKSTSEIAKTYIRAFYEDMGSLYVKKADIEPRATEHISEMIQMIQALINNGHAYEADGDVFFSVESYRDYGRLSGRRLEDMKAGFRVEVDQKKRHPLDFALWKRAKEGEPYWESPWGRGRPGWHMECSVMSTKYLGKSFDIHGGGEDLLFPHHENERAQSICAQGGEFARYWVHNGFVTMEGEKMSKSLGNFLTIRDAIKEYHPELLRLFLLSKHYRSPIDFRRDSVIALQTALIRLYRMIERLERLWGKDRIKQIKEEKEENDSDLSRFLNYLKDDINTAGAIGVLFDKVRALNRSIDRLEKEEDSGTEDMERGLSSIFQMADILGILNEEPKEFFERLHPELASLDMEKIERMIAERAEARAKKDFQKADAIRDELRSMGIILEDSPRGTVWRLDV